MHMETAGSRFDPERKRLSKSLKRGQKIRAAAVIAAGGAGTRMNTGIPKQFLEISGKPVLLHTVESIARIEEISQIVIALPEEHIPAAKAIFQRQPLRVAVQCVAGGPSRQESVRRGLSHVASDPDVVMVHDAVRPLCDQDLILRVLYAAWKNGAAIPGLPATETIQRVSRTGRVLSTPPREELYAIQTPQAFHTDILRTALDKAHHSGFLGTDESSVVRWAGHAVAVIPGSPDNIKITRPLDLEIAGLLMSRKSQEDRAGMSNSKLRIGQGIDYHRLVEGRKLILGGVEIPFEKGLEGHSDADVLSHAICDALLGAAALGDIGQHFPDTDPSNRGRSSLEFLRLVKQKIEAAGWLIRNVDATLLVERPRIAPYAQTMKRNIADSLGLSIDEVSIKATTTEGLNAEGRGEGISAQAIALLERQNTEVRIRKSE
jgi:2-C-methyl-D-erythritol 4-phosphate cytidylyltransferase / 2-C-methyl-D-erythritol 2,4-cyclodiphosphate synthase